MSKLALEIRAFFMGLTLVLVGLFIIIAFAFLGNFLLSDITDKDEVTEIKKHFREKRNALIASKIRDIELKEKKRIEFRNNERKQELIHYLLELNDYAGIGKKN